MGRVRWATAVVIAVASAIALSGCIPTSRSTDGWGFIGIEFQRGDANTQTLIAGDSLTVNTFRLDDAWFRLHVRNNTEWPAGVQHPVTVSGVGGISWAHYATESLLSGTAISPLPSLAAFLRPRVALVALGTNDARLIANGSGGYTQQDFQGAAAKSIDALLNVKSCVVLVNTTTHFYPPSVPGYPAQAAGVNAYLKQRVDTGGGRVRMATRDGQDWDTLSAGHPEWFLPNDYHHSDSGINEYRSFLVDNVKSAYQAGC